MPRHLLIAFAVLITAMACAREAPPPATADEEKALIRLEHEWMDAMKRRDAAALERAFSHRNLPWRASPTSRPGGAPGSLDR